MALNRRQPSARVQGMQGPMDAQSYLKQLEDLLKRNTGQGTFVGQDTSSNTPMYLPGKVANPSGLGETASTQSFGNGMQQPAPVQRPEPMQEEQGQVLGEQSQGSSIQDFLTQFTQSVYTPKSEDAPTSDFLDRLYQATGQVYGIRSNADGTVQMNDGSTRQAGQGDPFPIRSNADGTVGMSDGSSRRLNPQVAQQIGVPGFTQGVFGQNLDVTQQFGNYNPSIEPGSGYNMGTDLRTRDLQSPGIWPVDARVVQVTEDDGTQWGDQSGHQGYGNSVLIELPSGERIRMAHLSSLPQIGPDGMLRAGTAIVPGQTGNTYGEHLDYEYYAPGATEPSDPSQFSGFTNPMQYLPETQSQPQTTQIPQIAQTEQPKQQDSTSYPGQTINEGIIQPAANVFKEAAAAPQPMSPQRQQLGSGINSLGTKAGLPEVYAGEVASGQLTPGQGASYALEQNLPKTRIDTGLSEALRGDFKGAATNFLDTTSRVASRLNRLPGEVGSEIVKPAYADDGTQKSLPESLGENIAGAGRSVGQYAGSKIAQAGEGLKSLTQSGIGSLGNIFKPKQDVASRAVGDVAGTSAEALPNGQFSSLMDSAPSMSSVVKNDVRDQFFKTGGAEQFQQFLKPGAVDNSGGALTLDLFSDEFYQNPDNITNVFGGTGLQQGAQQKYEAFQAEQRRLEEEQRQREMSKPSLEDYIRQGKTEAQWYAETGQQSTRDALVKGGIDPGSYGKVISQEYPQAGTYTPQQAQQVGSTTGRGVQSVTYPGGRTVTAAPNTGLRADSTGSVQQVRQGEAPVAGRSAQLAYQAPKPQSAPSSNIFSKAKNVISNIFRR